MAHFRTTAQLLADTANPSCALSYSAAIGERASKIVARVMPDTSAAHGFYDPMGFVAACRYREAQNVLCLAIGARLAGKAQARFAGLERAA